MKSIKKIFFFFTILKIIFPNNFYFFILFYPLYLYHFLYFFICLNYNKYKVLNKKRGLFLSFILFIYLLLTIIDIIYFIII